MELKVNYTNAEVTVVWKPGICIHCGICANGLPNVFRPQLRPWVDAKGATTQEIVSQVKLCPSGALSFFMNADKNSNGK